MPHPDTTLTGSDGDELRRLFDDVPLGMIAGRLWAGGDTTALANAHLRLMFGYPTDAPDADVRPFAHERFPDESARQALLERLCRDGSVRDLLVRLRRVDGTLVWVELTASARVEDGQGALGVWATLRDVTERKRLDDQTRDLHQQLLQAEKLAALGQTISGVAHELNNPLATVLTTAERLAHRPLEGDLKRGIDTILGEAERAARIVRSLLTFARKRHTTRTMVDVNQVVRDTLALRAYEQRLANVGVVDALAAGLPPVFADPHQLQQVLLNLVINAEQAMVSANGRGLLVVRSWQAADRDVVVLEVNDDGPGLPEETLARVFDPFFTTKEAGHGTGLGLTVAYAIVEEHGGRLRAATQPGGGASFFVELPAAAVAPRQAVTRQPPLPRDVGGGARVLLVDDEARLADAVAAALQDAGFVVEKAGDGQAALELARSRPFDLVICDLRMPRLDGQAFYRAIATSMPALAARVIFVTGDVAGTEAGRFLEESGCRWLTKPFRLADLLRTAREALA
jgi:two-component system NtrC family sensor kinase